MKKYIHINSCAQQNGKDLYRAQITKLLEGYNVTSDFLRADIILTCDVSEYGFYKNLRENTLWYRYPDKTFIYTEIDNPPHFMHGIYSSARKSLNKTGRYASCGYYMHQRCFPNENPYKTPGYDMKKEYLFSFIGRNSHRVRRSIFKLAEDTGGRIIDSSQYNHFSGEETDKRKYQIQYWDVSLKSKYALCPRGAGTSSVRLFEMMEAGIAPVIISDDWIPCHGPSWEEFAIFVPEKEVESIPAILKTHEGEYAKRGELARKAWEKYFSPENYGKHLIDSILYIAENQTVPEKNIETSITYIYFKRN